jgi:hypothetical protein
LGFGWRIVGTPFHGVLVGETFRIFDVGQRGIYQGPEHARHEGLGVGAGLAWRAGDWLLMSHITRGRLGSIQDIAGQRRERSYRYWMGSADAGYAVFNSSGAHVDIGLGARNFAPESVWRDDYGHQRGWIMHALVALYVTIGSMHSFFDDD